MQVWHYCASCDMSLICLVMRCNKLSCEELKVVTAARPFQSPDPPFEKVCRTVWSLLHLSRPFVSIWKHFCSWSRSLTLSPISLISFTHPQWILKWFYYLDHYKKLVIDGLIEVASAACVLVCPVWCSRVLEMSDSLQLHVASSPDKVLMVTMMMLMIMIQTHTPV